MVQKQSIKVVDKGQDKTTGLYKIAAKIIKKVKTGSSFKTQLYQAQYPNKLLLNAVLMNVFKWEKVIDVLIDKSNILEKENNMDRELVYVLITELMWSKFGLKGNAKNIVAVKKYKNEFIKLMKDNELEKLSASMPPKVWKPRFFRVNTLFTTVENVLEKLAQLKYKKLKTPKTYAKYLELIKSDQLKGNTFVQDIHIKELLVFNSKVKFYKLKEYNDGSLIIQDKASCLAAYLLNPEPESTVLDMCAAPGMKTSHLASIMQNKGKLYAVDRCKERFNTLQNMLEKYGVKNTETFNMDALTFPYFDDVKYILVDPSCSGSGIVDRVRNDISGQNESFQIRLKKLANVHAQLLNHALSSYPNLERLVYSTCSANHEENEAVVDEALSVNGKFKLLDCAKRVKGWINKGSPGYDCSDKCLNAVPNVDCTNGFFIAVFVRRDYEEKVDDEVSDVDDEISEIDESSQIFDNVTKNVCSSQVKNNVGKVSASLKKNKAIKKEKLKSNGLNIKIDDNLLHIKNNENEGASSKKSKNAKRKANLKANGLNNTIDGNSSPIEKNKNNENAAPKKSKSARRKANIKANAYNIKADNISTQIEKGSNIDSVSATKIKMENNDKINSVPAKKRKIENDVNIDSGVPAKNVKKIKMSESNIKVEENPLLVVPSEINKKTETVPVVKSKNAKRRTRRLKLEQALGLVKKSKKSKKSKVIKT